MLYLEISSKLTAVQSAKQEAVEKYEKAVHQSSMLELDLKNTHDEISTLKTDLKTTRAKVWLGVG